MNAEITKTEGELKRKRGRPPKVKSTDNESEKGKLTNKLNDISFSDLKITSEDERTGVFTNGEETDPESAVEIVADNAVKDIVYYVLLVKINQDPTSYKEAMQTDERELWQEAVNEELNSMNKNH